MNVSMSRYMILAIMVSAFVVTALATSGFAFQPSDSTCSYRLAAATGSTDLKGLDEMGAAQPPSGNPQDRAKSDSGGTGLPDCYQTCMTNNTGFTRSLCWLGCDYQSDGLPWVP
jgi:hypothetical protein